MKVSRKWLNSFVEIEDISTNELANTLTNAGLEVESVEKVASGTNLVIGEVLECVDHPDSDHLHITQTNVGREVLQIVCGAPNVKKGQKVIVALVGAKLPEIEIKASTIRSVASNGMLCSLKELGVLEHYLTEEDKKGIKVLSDDAVVGEDPLSFLGLDDEILDIKQTPNRSDFYAMDSIAREVSALFNRPLKVQPVLEVDDEIPATFTIDLQSQQSTGFWLKEIHNLQVKPSPEWIQNILKFSGIGVHNNLVDISNLVMLETGQPMHFYDRALLNEMKLGVIDDLEAELHTLDNQTLSIQKGDLIITNGQKPVGLAGIKGLSNTMVSQSTKDIVIELAHFDAATIMKTSKRLGLISESSIRFSKPLNPLSREMALKRILYLLKETAWTPETKVGATVKVDTKEFVETKISVTLKQINSLLGTKLSLESVLDIFKRLNFNPVLENEVIICHVPSYRQDLFIKEDLIEEVIRFSGYDQIESTFPIQPLTMGELSETQFLIRKLEDSLVSQGLNQIESYTLVSKKHTLTPMGIGQPLEIKSPLSESRQYVRNALTESLIDTLSTNLAYQNHNEIYFELSEVYSEDKNDFVLGIVGSGSKTLNLWQKDKLDFDYFYLKGIVENVIETLGVNLARIGFIENTLDTVHYHPYQSAQVTFDQKPIGVFGVLHPALGIKNGVLLELKLNALLESKKVKTKFKPLLKYPSVKRDLAFVLDQTISVKTVIDAVKKAGKKELVSTEVFDVYPMGNEKSVGLTLVFENQNGTFTEEFISTRIEEIIDNVKKNTGALLR